MPSSLKNSRPLAEVTILYRDIRTYGFKERLYTEARRAGVRFIHFDFDRKPQVESSGPRYASNGACERSITGSGNRIKTRSSLVLSTPVVSPEGMRDLASRLKLSMDMDGFFLEAHVKLRPVDFAADGIFMAGMAHYPKFLDETIAQAHGSRLTGGQHSFQKNHADQCPRGGVDPLKCVGCLTCVRICPYDVPLISSDFTGIGNILGAAYIEPAVCHGCGSASRSAQHRRSN